MVGEVDNTTAIASISKGFSGRLAYLEKVRDFVKSMETASGKLQADYVPVNTKTPLRDTLLRYLGRRMHAKR